MEIEVDSDSNDTFDSAPTTGTSISSSGIKWKAKVNLSEFSTPRMRRIAQLGNRDIRRIGALEDAFPSATCKEDKSWSMITHACKPYSNLNARLKELEGDLATKDMLVSYVSECYMRWVGTNILIRCGRV